MENLAKKIDAGGNNAPQRENLYVVESHAAPAAKLKGLTRLAVGTFLAAGVAFGGYAALKPKVPAAFKKNLLDVDVSTIESTFRVGKRARGEDGCWPKEGCQVYAAVGPLPGGSFERTMFVKNKEVIYNQLSVHSNSPTTFIIKDDVDVLMADPLLPPDYISKTRFPVDGNAVWQFPSGLAFVSGTAHDYKTLDKLGPFSKYVYWEYTFIRCPEAGEKLCTIPQDQKVNQIPWL